MYKTFCYPDTLLADQASNLANWNSSGFVVTNEDSYSSPSSFTESENTNYGLLQSSSLELLNIIDLRYAEKAVLQFKANWNIEIAYDWVQVLASTDSGSTWQSLCGRYSSYGSDDQRIGEPVYDGFVNDWVPEEISLDNFLGNRIKLKFEFHSDQTHNFDGMHIDDINVIAYQHLTSFHSQLSDENNYLNVFPNPVNDFLLLSINNKKINNLNIVLSDIYGNNIFSETYTNSANLIKINTTSIKSGSYFLSCYFNDNPKIVYKIMIIH